MQKDHLYDGEIETPESCHENYQHMEIRPIKNCQSTVNTMNKSIFDDKLL